MDGSTPAPSARVRAYRIAVADEMEGLSDVAAATPSWCAGWRIRDVLGHLVYLAEATQSSMIRDLLRGGFAPDRTLAKKARDFGERPLAELCERLREAADRQLRIPGIPAATGVGDVMVHGNDALRPLGRDFSVNVEDVAPVLDFYRRRASVMFKQRAPKDVTLVAEDLAWSAGAGPEVRGAAIDLLLLLANRRQVVDRLSGPGVALLRGQR